MFPPDLRPPPEPLGFSARPSPTPGALGVPRPNGGRPSAVLDSPPAHGPPGFLTQHLPGPFSVSRPTTARPGALACPPRLRPPPGVPVLPRPPPAPGLTRAPPPDLRARGNLGFPASPAPSIASPPARTGAAIRVLYRILEMFSTRLNPPQHQIPPLQLGLFLLGAGVGGSVSKENHSGNRCLAVPSMVRSRSGGAGFRGDRWRGDPRPGHLHHPCTRPCPCTNRAPFTLFVSQPSSILLQTHRVSLQISNVFGSKKHKTTPTQKQRYVIYM